MSSNRRGNHGRRLLVAVLLLLSTMLASDLVTPKCFAGTGGAVSLPQPSWGKRIKYKSGIIAEISTRWTDGRGYRPIRITLTVRKTKADRTIRIDLVPHMEHTGFGGWREPMTYSTEVTIPEGEKSITKVVYVPQQTPWFYFRADFYEDNRKLRDLSTPQPQYYGNQQYNNGSPCVLLVDGNAPKLTDDRDALIRKIKKLQEKPKDLPDAEKFEFLRSQYYLRNNTQVTAEELANKVRATDDDSLEALKELPNVEILPPIDLPDQAIGLSGIDLIVISLDELSDLAKNDQDRFKAIDFFLRNGGNLIAFGKADAHGTPDGLAQIQTTLRELLNRDLEFQNPVASKYVAEVRTTFEDFAVDSDSTDAGYQLSRPTNRNAQRTQNAAPPPGTPLFSAADHGLGRVVAMDVQDPYEEHLAFWQWVMRTIGSDRLTWDDRHGISLVGNNNDYWDFMIPGFGASPVEGFLGVITLFILLIGPANFYLLKKLKRMYYLPLTVVAAALMTTITMMCYAVVSDGVATRVRLRSFTQLDQDGDENVAMSRCRQSYLAAITPSDGLVFPQETCVYPIVPINNETIERVEVLRERSKSRALTSGYVRSRTTCQFLTTNVETTELNLKKDGASIINGLGVDLDNVWVCDQNNNFSKASNVMANGKADLQPLGEMKEELIALNKLIADNRPAPPEGLDKTSSNAFTSGRNWNRWGYAQSRPAYTASALLHSNMRDVTKFFRNPKPNTFLVITSKAPGFIHQGTKATQEAGYHVVRGGFGS